MKPSVITSACIGVVALSSAVSADALSILNQDADEKTPPPPTTTEATSPWYVAGAVGGNYLLDSKLKDAGEAKFKFRTGIALNVGVGYGIAENLAVEIRSGLMWNKIDGTSGGESGFQIT
ncbi:MAG: hypothetical protein GY895_14095, partial [Phycisphaera sp.]|nr:hypothetical protein [Phycisphaera sp.]